MKVHYDRDKFQDRLIVDCTRAQAHIIKRVSGSRFRSGTWTIPYTYESVRMLQHEAPYVELDELTKMFVEKAESDNRTDRLVVLTGRQSAYELWEHQKVVTSFICDQSGSLVTAGVGVGKTRASLAAGSRNHINIVVCPKTVKDGWVTEGEALGVRVIPLTGTIGTRRKQIASAEPGDFIAMSYKQLTTHISLASYGSVQLSDKHKEKKELDGLDLGLVIVDEIHNIKDPASQHTRAVWSLGSRSMRRVGLTATPIVNHLGDLWPTLRFLKPDAFPSKWKFLEMFANLTEDWYGNVTIGGLKEPELFDDVFGHMHLHIKTDDVHDLPEEMYHRIEIELPAKWKKQYKELDKNHELDGVPVTSTLERNTRLNQIAQGGVVPNEVDGGWMINPTKNIKSFEVGEILDKIGDEKAVIFSDSKQLAEIIAHDHELPLITGDVSDEDRKAIIHSLNHGDEYAVVCTISTVGEGVNLTGANHAIYAMRNYSNASDIQTAGRIRRPGQQAGLVHFWDVITVDTIDAERKVEIRSAKKVHLEEVLDD